VLLDAGKGIGIGHIPFHAPPLPMKVLTL